MNIVNLEDAFNRFKEIDGVSYSIFNTHEYGDCTTCVNSRLLCEYGKESKGIFLKVWSDGMNAVQSLSKLKSVCINHEIDEFQVQSFYKIFSENFIIEPREYDRSICFMLKDK